MKIPKLKTKKICDFCKKLPKVLALRSFLTFFGLFALVLILGSLIFYKYIILIQKIEPQVTEKPLQFKEKTYEDILKTWQERENRFQVIDTKQYPNLFKGLTQ